MTDEELKLAAYEHAQTEFVKRLKKDAAELSDESYPLGCGAGVTTGRFHLAGCATGRWPADQKNESAPPRLAKATVTITREELDALIGYHNKALLAYGHVNEVIANMIHGLIETSFGERAVYDGRGTIAAVER